MISSSDISRIVLQTALCNSADATKSKHTATLAKQLISSNGDFDAELSICRHLCFNSPLTDARTFDDNRPAAAADLMFVSCADLLVTSIGCVAFRVSIDLLRISAKSASSPQKYSTNFNQEELEYYQIIEKTQTHIRNIVKIIHQTK